MALNVTPGDPAAEAYISAADADAYFLARGNATWAALAEDAKESALRLGTDYMDALYGTRWLGWRTTTTQALDWPRSGAIAYGVDVPDDSIPVSIQRANAELAVRASQGDLLVDEGAEVTQETVGPISVSYAAGSRQGTSYTLVDSLLAPWLDVGGGVAWAIRA